MTEFIKIQNLSKTFAGKKALSNITVDIPKNCITGIVGPSGSGKSVLLKILSGVLEADSGITIKEPDSSFMFQEGALFDFLTVYENVVFPLVEGDIDRVRKGDRTFHLQVEEALKKVGMSKAALKYPNELSGGMKRRVSLARAIVTKPSLLLLDDPTAGLDPVASSNIMKFIVDSQKELGTTVIMVSQDLRRLIPNCQYIIALFDGNIIFSGDVSALLSKDCPKEVVSFLQCRFDLKSSSNLAR